MKKTISLLTAVEDVNGDCTEKTLSVDIDSQRELEKLEHKHGGGSLTLEGTSKAVKFVDLVDGGTYSLVGGQYDSYLNKRKWTQVLDKALEESATAAVLEAATKELGKMVVLNDIKIHNKAGKSKQFDGLLVNSTAAVFVEAKHSVQPEHLSEIAEKLEFLEGVVRAGGNPHLVGITRVVPVLAGILFPAAMVELCRRDGVGVVKPNGRAFTFVPPPLGLSGARRGLHSFSRIVRLLR